MLIYTEKMVGLEVFAQCPSCKCAWVTCDDFLADTGVDLIGYRASFSAVPMGVFLFRHRCEGLTVVHGGEFAQLYDGPMLTKPQAGGGDCPGNCVRRNESHSCPTECECAYVREVIRIINKWPKRPEATGVSVSRLEQSRW